MPDQTIITRRENPIVKTTWRGIDDVSFKSVTPTRARKIAVLVGPPGSDGDVTISGDDDNRLVLGGDDGLYVGPTPLEEIHW